MDFLSRTHDARRRPHYGLAVPRVLAHHPRSRKRRQRRERDDLFRRRRPAVRSVGFEGFGGFAAPVAEVELDHEEREEAECERDEDTHKDGAGDRGLQTVKRIHELSLRAPGQLRSASRSGQIWTAHA